MSTRFDKCNASDFGLIEEDMNTGISPKDGSIWKRTSLYDFGWGKENGFYKTPLPNFEKLFEIALYSKNSDDMYGAAAVILDRFPDELLYQCELYLNEDDRKSEIVRLINLFKLKLATNRCAIAGKTYRQIEQDFRRWKKISEVAKETEDRGRFA